MKVVILHIRGMDTVAVVNSVESIPNFAFDDISYTEVDESDSTGVFLNRPELQKDLQAIFQDMGKMLGITLAANDVSPN